MIDAEHMLRLGRMQERVYRCIEDELRRDGSHKSYEGSMEVTFTLPNIFARGDRPTWMISLHAYVLPMDGRHKHWSGDSLADAIAKAEAGIDSLCEPYEMARFERDMSAMCDDDCEQNGGISYGLDRDQQNAVTF